ncbi:MAG: gluconokinase [Marmoricola sp.]
MSAPGGEARDRILVTGVSGSGKSTVGIELARRLGLEYADGDDFHSKGNVDKMTAGIALDDDDRRPWLLSIGRWMHDHDRGAVVACSALKRCYRDLVLGACPSVWFVQLNGDEELIRERQAARHGHYMPTSLMDSQFATFERLADDEPGLVVDVGPEVDEIVDTIVASVRG